MIATRETEIAYDSGEFWVHADKKQSAYVVYRSGITHSVSDSAYAMSVDGLSLAKARVDYLTNAMRKHPRVSATA